MYFSLSRGKLLGIFALMIAALLIWSGFYSAGTSYPQSIGFEDSADYAKSYGLELRPNAVSVKQTVLPLCGDGFYENVPIERYAAEEVEVYSYEIEGKKATLFNLYVYNGRIIGHEIIEVK